MSSKYWEIVELSDGTFVLQSSETNEEPLVKIQFSEQAKHTLQEQVQEVARAMIGAGVQAATLVQEAESMEVEERVDVLH